jgi:hypothetical protein
MTAEDVTDVLKEIVQRFCDREDSNAPALCEKAAEFIKNIRARISSINDKTADVEVDVDTSTGRRLLSSDGDLLDAATADQDASGDFDIKSAGSNGVTSPPTNANISPTAAKGTEPTSGATSGAATIFLGVATLLPLVLV